MAHQLPQLPCLCGNLRRAARALSQVYERAYRPLGLRSTQMTIFQALVRTGEIPQGRLGEILAMDSTSLTRTLAIMRREGWIAERCGKDRRERLYRLSAAGEAKLAEAAPIWEKIQSDLRRQLGDPVWTALFQLTHQLTSTLVNQGDPL